MDELLIPLTLIRVGCHTTKPRAYKSPTRTALLHPIFQKSILFHGFFLFVRFCRNTAAVRLRWTEEVSKHSSVCVLFMCGHKFSLKCHRLRVETATWTPISGLVRSGEDAVGWQNLLMKSSLLMGFWWCYWGRLVLYLCLQQSTVVATTWNCERMQC